MEWKRMITQYVENNECIIGFWNPTQHKLQHWLNLDKLNRYANLGVRVSPDMRHWGFA